MLIHSIFLRLTLLLGIVASLTQPSIAEYPDTLALRANVTAGGILTHLEAFQQIADGNDGNRAAGTTGYAASVAYVRAKLEAAGYTVTVQEFPFLYASVEVEEGRMLSPEDRDLAPRAMVYSPSTPREGVERALAVVPSDDDSGVGCEASDFAGREYTGTIALILRGTCPFAEKARNARDAGAVAALIYNNDGDAEAEITGTLGGADQATIPVAGITRAAGEALRAAMDGGSREVRIFLNLQTTTETRMSSNVIAETGSGDARPVVMAGAHLDSIEDGAGINDNGSGSATLLEIALQLAAQRTETENTLRFAFWGAEELGILGSQRYVSQLSDVEQKRITLYLNFDMVGSPNYARFVYADAETMLDTGPGEATVEQLFRDYFEAQQLPVSFTPIGDRSDHAAFVAAGIPVGGLFSGAEGAKTRHEAAQAGGTAGSDYDACYHQSCDTLANINRQALDEMADAAAHAILTFALPTATTAVTPEGRGKAWFDGSKLPLEAN